MASASDSTRPALAEAREEFFTPFGRPERVFGTRLRGAAYDAAIARAIEWRESRRCHCGALAYVSCAHRTVEDAPPAERQRVCAERMPFAGHRTQRQVREDEESQRIRRGLGK